MDTNELETSIVQIADDAPVPVLLEAGDKLAALGEFLKEARAMWEAKMVEHIQRNGPVEVGTVRYYVGPKRTTKCVDVPGAVEALLAKVEGDFQRFCDHLSSGAVKYGAARDTLDPADFDRLFTTTEETELKEGKPRLQRVDTKYLR
jgi:hypothetical protein